MFFRSEPNWQVVEPLRNVGWRCRKQFYLITNKTDSRGGQHILCWVGLSLPGSLTVCVCDVCVCVCV